MEDFLPSDGRYAYDDASDHPAYVLHFSARDLARFGWLYLNKGKWRDKQVVPEAWVAESTKPYSETDRGTSYGYLWWVAPRNVQFRTEVGPGAFSARGNGGQYVMVIRHPASSSFTSMIGARGRIPNSEHMNLATCCSSSLPLRRAESKRLRPVGTAGRATNRRRSSITELAFHRINTSAKWRRVLPMCPVRSVTYVLGCST
jgi:hypothetical protein